MDKQNRTESPEIDPHTHTQSIFDKGGKKSSLLLLLLAEEVSSASSVGKAGQMHVNQ